MDIQTIREAVEQIADEFAFTRVTLFGSQASGKSTPESDIDLILEFRDPISLLTLSMAKVRLEEMLGLTVDVVHGPLREDDFLEIENEIEIYAAET